MVWGWKRVKRKRVMGEMPGAKCSSKKEIFGYPSKIDSMGSTIL